MKKQDTQDRKRNAKPFFARYLEGQVIGDEDLQHVSGGAKPPKVTLKWPSDDDEYPIDI